MLARRERPPALPSPPRNPPSARALEGADDYLLARRVEGRRGTPSATHMVHVTPTSHHASDGGVAERLSLSPPVRGIFARVRKRLLAGVRRRVCAGVRERPVLFRSVLVR